MKKTKVKKGKWFFGLRFAIFPKNYDIFIAPENEYHLVKNQKKKVPKKEGELK